MIFDNANNAVQRFKFTLLWEVFSGLHYLFLLKVQKSMIQQHKLKTILSNLALLMITR